MVKETLKFMSGTIDLDIVVVPLQYPLVDARQSIIEPVERALIEHKGSIKMCIFSHISSMPTMIEPVKELSAISRAHGAISFVDGAHAPGTIPIDVQDIGCDFYTGNLHKWCFTPKGCAFLWVAPEHQEAIQPTVISSTGLQTFDGKFNYTGTRDYSAFCCIPAALRFRETHFGDEECRAYLHGLVTAAATELADAWGTYLLVPNEMCASMVNIVLPWTGSEDAVRKMREDLDKTYNLYVVYGKVTNKKGSEETEEVIWFVRISGAVYLEPSDFRQIKDLVPTLLLNA